MRFLCFFAAISSALPLFHQLKIRPLRGDAPLVFGERVGHDYLQDVFAGLEGVSQNYAPAAHQPFQIGLRAYFIGPRRADENFFAVLKQLGLRD